MTLSALIEKGFQVQFLSHAEPILTVDFPAALSELEEVLSALTIPVEQLVRGGGGETETTQGLRHALTAHGWVKHKFEIKKLIDDVPREFISHEVDHVRTLPKGTIALEIEWNNKDPFFDRDLENFKELHAEGAISVGILITRGRALQENMRAVITQFATLHQIVAHEDLLRFDLTNNAPTRSRRAPHASVRKAVWRSVGRDILCGQVRFRYHALDETRGSCSSRCWQPLPASLDWNSRYGIDVLSLFGSEQPVSG